MNRSISGATNVKGAFTLRKLAFDLKEPIYALRNRHFYSCFSRLRRNGGYEKQMKHTQTCRFVFRERMCRR